MSIFTAMPLWAVNALMTSFALAVSWSFRMTFRKFNVTFDRPGQVERHVEFPECHPERPRDRQGERRHQGVHGPEWHCREDGHDSVSPISGQGSHTAQLRI